MAYIIFDKEKTFPYVPFRFAGLEKPLTFHMKHVGYGKVAELRRQKNERMLEFNQEVKESPDEFILKKQWLDHVAKVENCIEELEDGKTREVTDAGEIYDRLDHSIIQECLNAMENLQSLTAGQRKNLEADSGSTSTGKS